LCKTANSSKHTHSCNTITPSAEEKEPKVSRSLRIVEELVIILHFPHLHKKTVQEINSSLQGQLIETIPKNKIKYGTNTITHKKITFELLFQKLIFFECDK